MKYLLIAITGYLLGSISPSYILGKILKGIDIREHGDHNAGTINTLNVLGFFPALITALFDISKGLLTAWIAYLYGIPYPYNFLFAYFTILGHIFPFYLNFRGGQGAATAIGVIFYFLIRFITHKIIPVQIFLALLLFVLFAFLITRTGEFAGILILPLLIITTLVCGRCNTESLVFLLFLLHVLGVDIYNIKRKGLLKKEKQTALYRPPSDSESAR